MNVITENNTKHYDVIVCGGGPAGFSAAVSAARCGAKTLLIEKSGCLGGIWTTGLLCWVLDIAGKKNNFILSEMFDRLTSIKAGQLIKTTRGLKFSCDVEQMKYYLEQKCISEGVDVLYHTMLYGANVSDNKIEYIKTVSKSGVEYFSAQVYIDATGDGDLGKLSNCQFQVGDEAGNIQPMSLIALVSGIDIEKTKRFNNGIEIENNNPKINLLEEMKKAGISPSYTEPTLMLLSNDGVFALMANHEYDVPCFDEEKITKATINARKELHDIVNSLKSLGGIWKNIHIVATAENIGVRDGRRIMGEYYLTKEDLFEGRQFTDAICTVGNKIDIHSTDKEGNGGVVHMDRKSKAYQIPLRSLIAKDNDSLLMAGRCISGDFYAHSTFRLTGNAVETGTASGVLAATAVKKNIKPREVDFKQFLTEKNNIK